jgi:Ca2+-transporting ATPase
MVFTTLTIAQMGNALASRSESQTLLEAGVFRNKMMLGAVLLTFVLQLGVVYLPFLQDIFSTQSLTMLELGISFGASLLVMLVIDTVKVIRRKINKTK